MPVLLLQFDFVSGLAILGFLANLGDLLVANDTRVFPAQLQATRGGARIGWAYAPPARAYAYPAPAYPAYGRPAAPPPPAYGYAPPPGRNSLGEGWGQQQNDARRGVRQGNVPLGQVMANIRRGTPGRILDAGLEQGPDGRPAYRVRWAAAGGRRIDFIVDAQTGAIIGQSGY